MGHLIAGITLVIVAFITIFCVIVMVFVFKYGRKKVDQYVKDLFTPNTVLMLRKFES